MTEQAASSVSRAEEIIDHLPVVVYRTTPDGQILEGNPAITELLGYTVAEFVSLHANDLYFEAGDRGPFANQRVEGSDIVRTILRLKHKDGHEVWAEDVGRAIEGPDGKVAYYDGTLVDVTAKMQAENSLHEREKLLHTIHEKAPISIFSLDPEGRVFEANPEAHRMLGLEPGQLLGKTISEFTYAEDAEESQQAFMRIRAGEADEVSLDKRYRRVDGKAIWGHVRAVAIRDEHGAFLYTISLVQEITERKRMEDAFRLLDELTRNVNEAPDLGQALQSMLDGICTSIGFAYGEAWLPDEHDMLVLNPAWHGEREIHMMKFRHISEKLSFGKGEGFPGVVAEMDDVQWFENMAHDRRNIRAASAAAANLQCAMGVAVRVSGKLIGVLMFMDYEREAPRKHTLRLVKFLADRLGSTVARRRLEMSSERQAKIMEAQIEGSAEGILVTASDGEVLMVNREFLSMCGLDCDAKDDSCRSMDLFARERSNSDFMDRFRRMYEDRTDGQGIVEIDRDTSYRRRMVAPKDVDCRVWYFSPGPSRR